MAISSGTCTCHICVRVCVDGRAREPIIAACIRASAHVLCVCASECVRVCLRVCVGEVLMRIRVQTHDANLHTVRRRRRTRASSSGHVRAACGRPQYDRRAVFVCVCVYLTSNTQQVRRASRYTHTHERARSMRCVFICEPHRSIHTLSGAQSVRRHRGAADRRARIRSVLAYLGLRLANARQPPMYSSGCV